MRVLLVGGGGQLGRELLELQPRGVQLQAPSRSDLDVTDEEAVTRWVGESRPHAVVNAAAYTAVDRAEEDASTAYAVNAKGPRVLAEVLRAGTARLIHVSTDFVFDGLKGSPYQPGDRTCPLGVYGASKLEGEGAVLDVLGDQSLVVRTSWLYSAHRSNFVLTMLRLLAGDTDLRVVSDQVGSPTWARGLATAIWSWLETPTATGIRHWADAGHASWFDLASATRVEAMDLGLLSKPARLLAVGTTDYPTAAKRPPMSVLDSSQSWDELGVEPMHWRDALREMLIQYRGLS